MQIKTQEKNVWHKSGWTLKKSQAPRLILSKRGVPVACGLSLLCGYRARVFPVKEASKQTGRKEISVPWGEMLTLLVSTLEKVKGVSLDGGLPTRMCGPLFAKRKLLIAAPP